MYQQSFRKPYNPPSPAESQRRSSRPFLFPETRSPVLADPSIFFSPRLLSSPLPTNSFFQNFVLKNGDQPEYIHPYLIKSSLSSLSLCYPTRFSDSADTYQIFNPDLTISASNNTNPNSTHIISSFSDLSVTLDLPSSNLRFFLVRGSPYLTCAATGVVSLSISTIHAILQLSSDSSQTKYTITLNNNQTWLLYASSPIQISHDASSITSGGFSGVIRIAILPDSDPQSETTLDRFSSCYPVSGDALFTKPFSVEYKWEKKGWGDLLMLAHPLHFRLLSRSDFEIVVLEDFKYKSIDGELVGVVGDSWVLKSDPVPITWHSIRGVKEQSYPEIRTIEPWLDGTFGANGFLYDGKWGGIVTKQGSLDSGADIGFGIYTNHHYHLGYFLYAIAVLAKIDPAWGRKYRPQAYSLMADFMNLGRGENSNYARLRCFDIWKLHSWAGGLTEFADGRNQESTSEAVNAYYSAALMGLAYRDTHLVAIGSTLSAMEIHSAQTWWHLREEDTLYPEDFTRENRVVGVLWANKRASGLWFASPDWRECRLGIQLLPLLPITEVLFSEIGFVREIVNWTLPALERKGVEEGWKGFVHALEGVYDNEVALSKIRNLKGFDVGNSLTNLLWWIHSRGDQEEGGQFCWFCHYCH
ncbi:endo-1,3(4)-beta-glucanase [Sarracenia purpurea var. burkii]